MTDYDFTTAVDRSRLGSSKWKAMTEANPEVPAGVVPLSVADLDMYNAPEIIDGLRDFLANGAVLGYTNPTQEYFDAVVSWMKRRHDWSVDQEWIELSPGVVPAVFTAVRAFTNPGDGVILQTPAYYPFYMAIDLNDRTLVRNPMLIVDGRYQIDFDGLETLARRPENKVMILCNPHNPTGRVWTRAELDRIAKIVVDNDLILVSDEIHSDLIMPGHQHVVAATLGDDVAQRCIVCTAPSKTFNLAGMAASNIIIPNEQLRKRFADTRMATGFFTLTTLGYKACELAYTKGEPWLAELIDLIDHNRHLVATHFAERFPDVTVFPLEGTYLQWIDLRSLGLDADELERRNTQEAYLYFDEGKAFGEDGAGFERINLATPTRVIEEALARFDNAYAPVLQE